MKCFGALGQTLQMSGTYIALFWTSALQILFSWIVRFWWHDFSREQVKRSWLMNCRNQWCSFIMLGKPTYRTSCSLTHFESFIIASKKRVFFSFGLRENYLSLTLDMFLSFCSMDIIWASVLGFFEIFGDRYIFLRNLKQIFGASKVPWKGISSQCLKE